MAAPGINYNQSLKETPCQKGQNSQESQEYRHRHRNRDRKYRDLTNSLECSVCLHFLLPPAGVIKCSEGHRICNKCVGKVGSKCPISHCWSLKMKPWNRLSEFANQCGLMKCLFYQAGCPYRGKALELNGHEESCIFGTIMCPVSICSKEVAKNDTYLHLQEFHKDMTCTGGTTTRTICIDKYPSEESFFLMLATGIVSVRIFLDDNCNLEAWASTICSKDKSVSFLCNLTCGKIYNSFSIQKMIPKIEDGECRINYIPSIIEYANNSFDKADKTLDIKINIMNIPVEDGSKLVNSVCEENGAAATPTPERSRISTSTKTTLDNETMCHY